MNDALVGVAGTVIGVVLGWGLNWWQGQAQGRRVRRGVRQLLRLECAQNSKVLKEFWQKVVGARNFVPGAGYAPDELEFHKRQRLASVPLSAWGHLMWESQAGLLATALSETEIEHAY